MTKRASALTKIVIFGLLIYLATTLLNLQTEIAAAEEKLGELQEEMVAQGQINAALTQDLANCDSPEHLQEVARDELGLIEPGERIFIAVN